MTTHPKASKRADDPSGWDEPDDFATYRAARTAHQALSESLSDRSKEERT